MIVYETAEDLANHMKTLRHDEIVKRQEILTEGEQAELEMVDQDSVSLYT